MQMPPLQNKVWLCLMPLWFFSVVEELCDRTCLRVHEVLGEWISISPKFSRMSGLIFGVGDFSLLVDLAVWLLFLVSLLFIVFSTWYEMSHLGKSISNKNWIHTFLYVRQTQKLWLSSHSYTFIKWAFMWFDSLTSFDIRMVVSSDISNFIVEQEEREGREWYELKFLLHMSCVGLLCQILVEES